MGRSKGARRGKSKGGRPQKPGPRTAGDRPVQKPTPDDTGTNELKMHKLALTKSSKGDMSALGILRGRDVIDEHQYEAGQAFERCYRAYIGNPDPRCSSFELRSPGVSDVDEAHIERMKMRYWNCLSALNDIGSHVFNLVRDICLFDRSNGFISEVISLDVTRSFDNEGASILICRRADGVPPYLRHKIAILAKGLEVLDGIPAADFSREAEALRSALIARSLAEQKTS